MGLHRDFPEDPFILLDPTIRWFPADESLRQTSSDKLMPPLVPELRRRVQEWRTAHYSGAADTSRALLRWWFDTQHLVLKPDGTMTEFRYYFAQREALETIVYLHDVAAVHDKHDMMRYDSSGEVKGSLFQEAWPRFVVKMATGSGKTKVLSLVLAWSFFHKLYESQSDLSRNFLVITPNIIVLDRIRRDFEGLKIFLRDDPILPEDGTGGHNWRDDFQLTVHIQDDVRLTRPTGNIFLTNIHRVYTGSVNAPSSEDEDLRNYYLGQRPLGATNDSKVDLGVIVRDIDELMILNDEAHHIHDERMAWFTSIQDIHNRLLQKGGSLCMQVDTTATPKHNNGAIFVQTIADYPLVEAIHQNVVKHPVLPDAASRAKLLEQKSAKFTEKYRDYVDLGVLEWRKAAAEHDKLGMKAILFVMTDDTRNCDEVAAYLESHYQDLKGAVLLIHTNNNGEISEASSGKSKDELDDLREKANAIDDAASPYKAIISVMMLKEGWDVRNVVTIVGLRAYTAPANILPEQTLGRGLRKMYSPEVNEEVSVVGTDAFMDFVESIRNEGVILDYKPMGAGTAPKAPIIVEVDNENPTKDIDALDIELPVLTPRIFREYKNLSDLDLSKMVFQPVLYAQFTPEQQREIVFKDITNGKVSHVTILDSLSVADHSSVLGYFAQTIMRDLRLVSGYDVLYGKVKLFVQNHLFGRHVELDDGNTLRNLSELEATKTIIEVFKKSINELTVIDRGDAEIRDYIKLRKTRPFTPKEQEYVVPKKSVFNRIVGQSHLELEFAHFLDECPDVIAFAKNSFAVHFKLDFVNSDGDIADYYPDFIVKTDNKHVYIVETKGEEDLDVPFKTRRLRQWCQDLNRIQSAVVYDFVYVDEASFRKYNPTSFEQLVKGFREYKDLPRN